MIDDGLMETVVEKPEVLSNLSRSAYLKQGMAGTPNHLKKVHLDVPSEAGTEMIATEHNLKLHTSPYKVGK